MNKDNLKNAQFFLIVFVIACCTFLTAIGRIDSKDYQAIVTMILGVYAGAKAIFNRKR